MVVCKNNGTPICAPTYYSPYYGDPQKGYPNFGKPPYARLGFVRKAVGLIRLGWNVGGEVGSSGSGFGGLVLL